MPSPIPFLTAQEDGKYVVSFEAKELLSKVHAPLAVGVRFLVVGTVPRACVLIPIGAFCHITRWSLLRVYTELVSPSS